MKNSNTPDKRGEKLLPTQRQSYILDVLAEQKVVSLHLLSERLGASFSTVRRDLDELVRKRVVERTHGGAMLTQSNQNWAEVPGDRTSSGNIRAAKESIGKLAATRIREGDSVIFDSSTTVLEAARIVAASRIRVTAVTNSIKIADLLATSENVRLIVPGGSRRAGTFVLAGEPGDSFFRRLHADIAFIGAQSASDGMLNDSRIESASAKRILIGAARTRILLIDSWKFGGPNFCDVAPLTEFEEIITDDALSEEQRYDLERRGIFVQTEAGAAGSARKLSTPEEAVSGRPRAMEAKTGS
ncbi:MAG: bacterial regulatory, arsR family protein [Herminiimonas sp.]|nr:bacterial regulatory, arsR family protein [Herminiimonas sp.]